MDSTKSDDSLRREDGRIEHPTLDDTLPKRPKYQTSTKAEIDAALGDLLKAAREDGNDYLTQMAANMLGAYRIDHGGNDH